MKVNSVETFSMTKFTIEDAAKKPVSLKIEAAHAGIVNGNYIFYTPKALKEGSKSLKEFFKPLQKKHFDKTLGYIYDAVFESKVDSKYLEAINTATTPEELGKAVKKYYYSDEYTTNREGFGVLISKARLYDDEKINKLAHNDKGYVSIAGDSHSAVCSICYGNAAECEHELGSRYGKEVCFAIADSLELDHISFEDIPANWKTNTLIITDAQVLGKVELIEEGQTMKLTLEAFKEKLANIENILTELNLTDYLEAYKADVESAKGGDFLFPKEKLLPLNTKLGAIIATKLLDLLEDGTDKDTVANSVNKEYTKLLGEVTIEEAVEQLVVPEVEAEAIVVEGEPEVVTEEVPLVVEETTVVTEEESLKITDADQMVLKIIDSVTTLVDTKLADLQSKVESLMIQDAATHQNKIYEDRIEALQQDIVLAQTTETQLLSELKTSLLSQIALLKQVDVESDYFTKLETRSVRELQMTLEDHVALTNGTSSVTFAKEDETVVESTVQTEASLAVTDSQKQVEEDPLEDKTPVNKTDAVASMSTEEGTDTTASLAITDADAVVSKLVSDLGNRSLGKAEYASLYKSTATEHGIATAKKLHAVLKQQFKI